MANPFLSHHQSSPASSHSSLSPREDPLLLSPVFIHSSPAADLAGVSTIPPPAEITTLGETGSLIRSTLDMGNIVGNTIDDTSDLEITTSESYSCISSDEESETGERLVPCKHCFALVNDLKAEIADLKKRQLPYPSNSQSLSFLEGILNAYKRISNEVESVQHKVPQEAPSTSEDNQSVNDTKVFSVAAPGKQELVPGSGLYISSTLLHSIHSQCNKDPKKLFLLLIEAFFTDETLATSLAHGSRNQTTKGSRAKALNQEVVKTIKAYTGRFAALNNMEFPVAKMNRVLTNKVGTAKRKKLKELQRPVKQINGH